MSHIINHTRDYYIVYFQDISSKNWKQVFKFENAEKNYFIGVSSRAFGTMEYTVLGEKYTVFRRQNVPLFVVFKSSFASPSNGFMQA